MASSVQCAYSSAVLFAILQETLGSGLPVLAQRKRTLEPTECVKFDSTGISLLASIENVEMAVISGRYSTFIAFEKLEVYTTAPSCDILHRYRR